MFLPGGMSAIGSLAGLIAVMTWRLRGARSAVSTRKTVIPPLGMTTNFSMFMVPAFRIPWAWAVVAFLIGAILFA